MCNCSAEAPGVESFSMAMMICGEPVDGGDGRTVRRIYYYHTRELFRTYCSWIMVKCTSFLVLQFCIFSACRRFVRSQDRKSPGTDLVPPFMLFIRQTRYRLTSRKTKIMSNIFLLYKDVCDFLSSVQG